MKVVLKSIFLLFIFTTYSKANTFSLYIASTQYQDIAKKYIEEVNDILQIENLIVRTHQKGNYSLLVRNISDRKTAKSLQEKLKKAKKYPTSFIKNLKKKEIYFVLYETKMDINGHTKIKKKDVTSNLYHHKIESSNEYITAITMYNLGNYKKSYNLFNKLFFKYSYNVNINYFLAQSAIKIKKYDEASLAFERVLIEKPDFIEARYDYAKLLYKIGLKNESKIEFNKLLSSNIDKNKKDNINKYLKELNKKRKSSFGSATLVIGVGRSNNINNGLDKQEFQLLGFGNATVEGEKPKKDNFHNEVLSVNFSNIVESNPLYKIDQSIFAYNKNYFNEKEENTSVLAYAPKISYLHNKYIYALGLNGSKIFRKNDASFYTYSMTSSIQNKKFNAGISHERNSYLSKDNKGKEFKSYNFSLNYNILTDLRVSSKISKLTRLKKLRTDLDKVLYSLSINYNHKINNNNMLYLGYQFELNKYKYFNILFDSKRKDKNHSLSLGYIYSINKENKISLSSSFTKNYSNQDAYVFKETEGKLNYLRQFKW